MRGFFSVKKTQYPILITLLIVILLLCVYFFVYIPKNERNLQAQRFRVLQNIDVNIQAKIDNSTALLDNLLSAYIAHPETTYRSELKKYVAHFPKKDFSLLPALQLDSVTSKKQLAEMGSSTQTVVQLDSGSQQFTLFLRKDTLISAMPASFRIGMKSNLKRFIGTLLPSKAFDNYVVFNKGKLLWETFSSGITEVKNDSLLNIKDGISASTLRMVNIRGVRYMLFVQPVRFGDSGQLLIGGLLSAERYQTEKTQLQLNIVLLLSTIVIILMVAFPWLKLYQMGSKDRLRLRDGISSLVVAILLCSLLFFVFFKYNLRLRPDRTEDAKKNIATAAAISLQQEIDSAYKRLYSLDSLIAADKALQKNLNNISNLPQEPIHNIIGKGHIHEVFWLDQQGAERYNWTSRGDNAPLGNFSSRKYFRSILDRTAYELPGKNDQIYYLDQIISWTSGGFTSVISRPSALSHGDTLFVAAMSFDLQSLQKVVLTEGYQVIIVNDQADVIYHQDPTKNLNENLVNEFSEKDELTSAIQARTATVLETKYAGGTYSVRVQPLDGLPYFVVVLSDTAFKETRDMEVYGFTVAMMICFFGFLVFQLIVTFLSSAKRTFLKRQQLDTSWVAPKISSHRQYNESILINVMLIGLMITFSLFSTFLQFFFILLLSASLSGLFLNLIFALAYKMEHPEKYLYKKKASLALIFIIITINFLAAYAFQSKEYLIVLAFQLIACALAWLIDLLSSNLLGALRNWNAKSINVKWTFTGSFSMMALTRLLITSGVPIVFFYISVYNYEQNLNIRHRHIAFARDLLTKYPQLNEKSLKQLSEKNASGSAIFLDKGWVKEIDYSPMKPPISTYSRGEDVTIGLFRIFRMYKSDHAIASEYLFYPNSADEKLIFNHLLEYVDKEKGTRTAVKLPHETGYLMIRSAGLNYKTPELCSLKGACFWFLLLLCLFLLYVAIHQIIKKLFAQNLPSTIGWEIIDQELLSNNALNNLLFVIGLPGSGKLDYVLTRIRNGSLKTNNSERLIYDKFSPEKSNVKIADLIVVPEKDSEEEETSLWTELQKEVQNDRYKLVIVNHFEYNLKDPNTNNIKLNFLEHLMLQAKSKIIVLSTVHPVTFLDSLNVTERAEALDDNFKHDLERWHVLLGHFRILIQPLQSSEQVLLSNQWEDLIVEETAYTHFLKKMQQPVIKAVSHWEKGGMPVDCSSLAFKLHATSHYFYMYLWQSLTREEKFLLYDLAEEGLVNSYDDYNLSMLISKGIIISSDGRLKLFNKGFRNFILTAIGSTEAMKIRNEIKDNGNWSTMKGPLQIVIIAILVFLFVSQQETYSRILTYVAALGAGIPTVLKLFSLFDKTEGNGGK